MPLGIHRHIITVGGNWDPADSITTAVWFDASDTSSYSTSGSDVTAVTDKGNAGATITVGGTPNVGASQNSLPVFTFDAGDNEDFFDYSNGFEEFAILTSPDATLLDSAAIGISDSPTAIAYDVSAPSGTPEPPLLLLLAVPGLLLWRYRRR